MHEYVNAVTCAVMLALCFPVSVAMNHRGLWLHRIVFAGVATALGAQVVAPWYEWLPNPNWLQTVCNVVLICVIVLCRREAMQMVRMRIGHAPATHPMRRADDRSIPT